MKVIDAIVSNYEENSSILKDYMFKAYEYIKYNRVGYAVEKSKDFFIVTLRLKNGLNVSCKKKSIDHAKWILWYKAIEQLAFSGLYYEIKYQRKMLTFSVLDYTFTDYTKKYKFRKKKLLDGYEGKIGMVSNLFELNAKPLDMVLKNSPACI